ncbi:MAG: hypothetical protein U5Q16_11835 [Gammaproteobacteria bacterium]|nr:hypothetical protein [Gammaproteobacteria bacterium]
MVDLEAELQARLAPVLDDLTERAMVTEHVVDKDVYRILICTLWVNVVLDPAEAGIAEHQLETLHDVLNRRIGEILGRDASLKSCFRYLNGKDGEQAMKAARLTPNHRDMLLYFASIILDPDGHRRWMEELRDQPSR